ncbi:MAG: hypothetical protein K0Q72_1472 [Armatimonadetes bacterium]|jgi:hypothetical protein|nr:hypothetical protein [Armatimonadota bacterium]
MAFLDPSQRERCPCCGYLTLRARAVYEICELCCWEDDGQDDPRADEVWGGPNHGYSLTQARENFRRYLVMYEPERDRRICGPDNEAARDAKRLLIHAFEQLETASPDERPAVIAEIRTQERRLRQNLKELIREYEAAVRRSREL